MRTQKSATTSDDVSRTAVSPGWYRDPKSRDRLRYWDGETWSSHTHDRTSSGTTPSSTSQAQVRALLESSAIPASWSEHQKAHLLVALGVPFALIIGAVGLVLWLSGYGIAAVATESDSTQTTTPIETTTAPEAVEEVLGEEETVVASSTTTSPTTTTVPLTEPVETGAGTYVVGTEILPGVYRVSISWARLDDEMDVIDNDLTLSGISIMTVYPTDSFVELTGTAMPLDLVPSLDPIETGFTQGTYLVGPDLVPGRYRITSEPGATAFAARLKSDLTVIDSAQSDDSVEVDLLDDDFALRYTGTLELVG